MSIDEELQATIRDLVQKGKGIQYHPEMERAL